MKKKIMAIAMAVAVLALMVGTSLAWFTDSDEATNTFTIGSIEIDLKEDFEEPTGMLPVVNVNDPTADPNFVNKDAWVENTGDNPAYVQMFVAIPKALDDVGAFHVVDGDMNAWTKVGFAGTTDIDGVTYNVYKYIYNSRLEVGTATAHAITGAYLDAALDYNKDTNRFVMNGTEITDYVPGDAIYVYVAAQGIQAEGFADAASALATFGTELPQFKTN
jgi:predicted ribosomally synthesized peptide with SipW-like signal peptide